MRSLPQLLLGLCLSPLVHADGRSLLTPSKFADNSTSSIDSVSLLGIRGDLEKRYCPSGTGYCDYSGRCCYEPADACCEDGTCIEQATNFCCSGGGTCPLDTECCEGHCNPGGTACCRDGGYCDSGEACIVLDDGSIGCCPLDGCYEAWQVIYWYYYVYWYVYVYIEITVEVTTTTLSLTSSLTTESTTITVTASNSAEASSIFEDYSYSLSESAATTPDLDELPTSTITTSSPRATPTSSYDDDDDYDDDFDYDDSYDDEPGGSTDDEYTSSTETRPTVPGPASPTDDASSDANGRSILAAGTLWAFLGGAGLSFTMMAAL
ncbi:uncharacterized protein BJX67DRAFT_200361 [Aspergillus lucknowensis]|uniref:GPI anchored protein n=1 Tax=Aspergillus lucknowensis TaxID=176173 RepID=A0ABR4LJY1_9EURO